MPVMFQRLHFLLALGISAVAAPLEESAVDQRELNNIGITPALGWSSWNAFGGDGSTAAHALDTSNYFISLGLNKLGYTFVNIDDCWPLKSRDSSGNLVADPSRWPNGIKSVTDQIHSMGLKFGLYGDSGTSTCAGYPGSQGYETQDAKQLAAWGVDYWKYDNCATPSTNSSIRYTTMSKALLASGRTILYSLCNWGGDSVWTWGGSVGNSWRVTGDITDSWSSVAQIAASSVSFASYAQPGGFNDYDMLEIGNGGLTTAEERAHFGLWALMKSPLILGTDLSKIPSSSLAIIKNAGVIAINQDSLGKAATYFTPSGQAGPTGNALYPYWAGPLSDGVVIGLVAVNGATTLSANFADVPGLGSGTYSWTELYSSNSGTGTSVSANLVAHDMAIFKVKKSGSTTSTAGSKTTTSSTPTSISTAPTSGSSGVAVAKYGQCGGIGWTGSTTCVAGSACTVLNPYYSQCL